jgi:hypothetical protein
MLVVEALAAIARARKFPASQRQSRHQAAGLRRMRFLATVDSRW